MILPNKLVDFQESLLPKTVFLLDELSEGDLSIIGLYLKVKRRFEDLNQYILTLDVLYVLGKIKFNEKNRKLEVTQYVEKNNMR